MSFLHAQIERITYANEETGYAVAKVYAKGHDGLVCVVGILPSPNPGEILKMQGCWESHPKYGQQFKVQTCETVLPATANAIQKRGASAFG
ncbi:YrrC family ATP-dependent DNA helicase [Desulfonatronum parangueonense]